MGIELLVMRGTEFYPCREIEYRYQQRLSSGNSIEDFSKCGARFVARGLCLGRVIGNCHGRSIGDG